MVPEKKELWEKLELLSENKKNYMYNLINLKSYKLDTYEAKILDPNIFLKGLEVKINSEYEKIKSFIYNYIKRVESLIKGLNLLKQDKKINDCNLSFVKQFNYFQQSFNALVKKKSDLIKSKASILYSCSYERWLEKGFVLVKGNDGKLIKNINILKKYDEVALKFVDGKAKVKIISYEEK